jgi:3-hydroxypropanoate dehydrogenase
METDCDRRIMDDLGLDLIFRAARSHNGWLPKDVEEALLRRVIALARLGPTSTNSQPARFVFVRSAQAKAQLAEAVSPGNKPKVLSAPITAIVAYDERFFEHLPRLFPHKDVRGHFEDDPDFAEATAFRNSTLQGAYFIVAARALGLDCGPLSGFDHEAVDRAFLSGTSYRSNFLCSVGFGKADMLFERLPRLEFEEACSFV